MHRSHTSVAGPRDVIRLDHFRGFAAAWHVPAGATTAKPGQWLPGPGADFFNAVKRELGVLPFIAEDLGLITPDVSALRDEFQMPGTRVLQFAFDGSGDNPYLPHNYVSNTVVYTGTHDNPTSREWYEELQPYQQENLWRYLNIQQRDSSEAAWHLIRLAWSSKAALAIAPLQDLLNLGFGSSDECSGPCEWQLDVAMQRRHVIHFWLSFAAGVDKKLKSHRAT